MLSKIENVEVQSELDKNGQMCLCGLVWKKKKLYKIERVIHICKYQDEGNNVLRYTVLIDGKQKYLYNHNNSWYVRTVS